MLLTSIASDEGTMIGNWEGAILQAIDEHEGQANLQQVYKAIPRLVNLTGEQLRETQWGGRPAYQHGIRSYVSKMRHSGELARTGVGEYQLTEEGRKRLADIRRSDFKGNTKNNSRALLASQPTVHDAKRTTLVGLRGLGQGVERSLSRGAGFGDPETNRKIERAGINVAKRYYSRLGWSVRSVERENRGYDLCCQKDDRELHVEVKGAAGSVLAFTLTRKEHVCAFKDKQFELCFVASARDRPEITTMSGTELLSNCDFMPLAYRVVRTAAPRAGKA